MPVPGDGRGSFRDANRAALVTGATGFIGANLCAALGRQGAVVHGLARHAPTHPIPGLTSFHVVDLSDVDACRALVGAIRPETVFHLASHVTGRQDMETISATLAANLVSTVNLLAALHHVGCARSVVIAGSSEEPRRFVHGDVTTAPCSPYAAAKLGASAYAAMFRSTFHLPVSHARIFMGYGPCQLDLRKLVPYVTVTLLRGGVPSLSSGARRADFTFIDDIVAGLVTLAARPDIETLDIGTGNLTSVRDIAVALRDLIDPHAELAFGAEADRVNETELVADARRSEVIAGWRPRVAVADGLRRTVDWYRAQLPLFE